MTVSATIVTQYYTGIFRQAPSAAVSTAYQAMSDSAAALNSMLSAANLQVDPVVRLYQTAFNRLPDNAGFTAWVVPFSTGAITLQSIANGFTTSTEFTNLYPTSMSNAQFVGALYWNILQRQGEDAGIKGWVDALNSGALTRAQVLLGFSESGEFTKNIEPAVNSFLTNIANTPVADQGGAALYTGSLFDQGGAPVTTYNLTTNIDTFVANGANNLFNASLGTGATLNSFDTAKGSGLSTFNLIDTRDATFVAASIPAGATISGMTTVNLSRSGAAGATTNAATVTNTTFGTGVQSFNLVDAGTGNAGAVSVTLNSAKSVSAKSTGTNAFGGVTVTDTDATSTTTQGSTLATVTIQNSNQANAINANGVTTVNLQAATALTTITSAAGTRALTVNASGTTAQGGLTDAQATTATLNISGNAAFGTLTVAKATTVSVTATAVASTDATTATIAAAKMTALNVGGTHAQTLTLTGAAALATITVTGSGGVALGDLSGVTTLTSVDTSAATNVASATGAANKTVANSVQLGNATAFTGGAGSDTVTVGATTKAINLGTGVNKAILTNGTTGVGTGGTITGDGDDTLSFATTANAVTISASATLSSAFKTAVTGFSTLELAAIGANTIALDVTKLSATAITTLSLTGNAAASDLTVSNLGDGATIKVTGANTGATTTTAGTTGSGSNDTLNISLSQGTNAAVAFGTFVTPNIENIKFVMADTQATPVGYYNTATLTDAAVRSITVSGNSGLDLAMGVAATSLQTFDASGVTLGGVKFTSGALQYASTVTGSTVGGDTLNFSAALAAVTVTTTAGANSVYGSSTVASTFNGGSGVDTFFGGTGADTVNGNAGADVVYGNNAGTKAVETITFTAAAQAGTVLTINGTAVTFDMTAVAGASATNFIAAFNATELTKLYSAAAVGDVVTLTGIADGAGSFVRTTDPGTKVALAVVTAGTSTTTGADVMTGGAGSDTFMFGISSAAPSATALQTIADFNAGAVSDYVFYNPTLVALANTVATATNGTAAISANGIATFTTSDQASLAASLTAVASAIQANTTAAGKSVAFQYGSDAYMFISDANNGVTAGDVLVKLTGVNLTNSSTDVLIASGHTLTLA